MPVLQLLRLRLLTLALALMAGRRRRRMKKKKKKKNEEQAAAANGMHLSAAERIRNRRFKVRFKKLRAHKQRRVLHAVVSLYPDGKC